MAEGEKRNHLQNKLVLELQTLRSPRLFDWFSLREIWFVNKMDMVWGGEMGVSDGSIVGYLSYILCESKLTWIRRMIEYINQSTA